MLTPNAVAYPKSSKWYHVVQIRQHANFPNTKHAGRNKGIPAQQPRLYTKFDESNIPSNAFL